MKKLDRIKVHIYNFAEPHEEIKTRNQDLIFLVCQIGEELGIFWDNNRATFTPFKHFAPNVVFENVDTAEKFHVTINGEVEKIA